jgi:hypothetical protein
MTNNNFFQRSVLFGASGPFVILFPIPKIVTRAALHLPDDFMAVPFRGPKRIEQVFNFSMCEGKRRYFLEPVGSPTIDNAS